MITQCRYRLTSLILLMTVLTCQATAQTATPRAFSGARIIDGNRVIENGVLLVEQGRISAVGTAAEVVVPSGFEQISLRGKTIMPGIINSHGHAGDDTRDKLGRYARYGVTTVVSLGGESNATVSLRDAQEQESLQRARIFLAGPVLNPDTEQEARSGVDQRLALQVDWIKTQLNFSNIPVPVYSELIRYAHANDLPVAAHMVTLEDTLGLLQAGADFLAHSVRDQEVNSRMIELMQANDVCLTPTLTRDLSTYVYESVPAFFSDPFFLKEADPSVISNLGSAQSQRNYAANAALGRDYLAMAQHNLGILHEAGAGIALGTDSGASPPRFVGYFEHLEMELMAEAGMPPLAIIHAATAGAARCTGLSAELGSLEAGKWADFIVLTENPLEDIRNTRTLEAVWVAGNPVPGI